MLQIVSHSCRFGRATPFSLQGLFPFLWTSFHLRPLHHERLRLGVKDALLEPVVYTLPALLHLEVLCQKDIFKIISVGSQEENTFGYPPRVVDIQEVLSQMIPPEDMPYALQPALSVVWQP